MNRYLNYSSALHQSAEIYNLKGKNRGCQSLIDNNRYNFNSFPSVKLIINKIELNLPSHQEYSGELSLHLCVSFNDKSSRKHFYRFPDKGTMKFEACGKTEIYLDQMIFEEVVSEFDEMKISFLLIEKDMFTSDNELPFFEHVFNSSPDTWKSNFKSAAYSDGDQGLQEKWKIFYSVI